MRRYEVMVILDPDLEERTVAPSLDTFLNVVRKDGGTVDNVDIWGRRRLAYEINKKSEGIYAVLDLTCDAGRGGRARPSALAERVGAAHQGHALGRRRRQVARAPPAVHRAAREPWAQRRTEP